MMCLPYTCLEFHHYDTFCGALRLLQGEGDDIYLDTYDEDGEEGGVQAKGSLSDVEFDSEDEDWDSDELETEFDDDSASSATPFDAESTSSTTPEATFVDQQKEERHLQS